MPQASQVSTRAPAIVFTGTRMNNRFLVRINDQPVELRPASFRTLLAMVLQRARSESGYVSTARTNIFRLREAVRKALNSEIANAFIETGGRNQYRLPIRRNELRSRIGVTRCFSELVLLKIVTPAEAEKLKRLGRSVKLM